MGVRKKQKSWRGNAITMNPLKQKIITLCGGDMDIFWNQNLYYNSNLFIRLIFVADVSLKSPLGTWNKRMYVC